MNCTLPYFLLFITLHACHIILWYNCHYNVCQSSYCHFYISIKKMKLHQIISLKKQNRVSESSETDAIYHLTAFTIIWIWIWIDDKDQDESEALFLPGQGQHTHTHSLAHTHSSVLDWSALNNPYAKNHGNTPLNSIHGNQDAATPINQSTTRSLQVFTRYVRAYAYLQIAVIQWWNENFTIFFFWHFVIFAGVLIFFISIFILS